MPELFVFGAGIAMMGPRCAAAASPSALPFALLAFAPMLWGGNFIVGRYVGPDIGPHWMNIGRWSIAAIVLLPVSLRGLIRDGRQLFAAWPRLIILSILGIVCANTLIYASLQYIGASVAAILFSTVPLLTVFFTTVIEKRFPACRLILLSVLSMCGVWLVQHYNGPASSRAADNLGEMFILGAAVAWALYWIAVEKLTFKASPLSSLMAQIVIGLLIQIPLALLILDVPPPQGVSTREALALGYIGIFAAAAGFLCWQFALKSVPASLAGAATNLIPVWSLLLAWILLGETLNAAQWLGMALIVLAIILTRATGQPVSVPLNPSPSSTRRCFSRAEAD
ncbi:DMT family transporter [Hoeflea sp. WL0058]|uniref:DMT family transporter n=1 Tax=Flavimaribacter sediminis TaxID=2865987 RepID=A0AAE3CYF1_9HYPH|nr:DMT family transporter [Flavimaribacter sediminis]MBW8635589.1 DMT family transporter [Flavimaribacter sediminis]